jgi:hypothetical protein
MRRLAIVALLAPTGCFSASSGGSGPDANFNPQQDAEFMDSGPGPDSSMAIDSSVDAPVDSSTTVVEAGVDAPVETGPQPITVVVTNALGPESGVTVVFQDATGAPILTPQTTDASGTVVETMAATGDQVTVVMGTAVRYYLFTVQGIALGDTIAVYDPTADAALSTGEVSVDSWPDAAPPGAANYQAAIGRCGGGNSAPPIAVYMTNGCEVAAHYPVLLTASDVNGTPVGYDWQKGNAIAPDDAGISHVTVSNPWSTTSDTLTVSGSGVPAFLYGDDTTIALTSVTTGVPTQSSSEFGPVTDAGVSWPFTVPAGYADSIQAEANVSSFDINFGVAISAVATRGAPPADSGTTSIDMSPLLPTFNAASVDVTSTDAGAAQPLVNWSLIDAGSVAAADGVLVTLLWSGGSSPGVWTLVAPPTATSVQTPALPPSAPYAPSSSAFWPTVPAVAIVQASFFGGYAGLRAQAGTAGLTSLVANSWGSGAIVPPLPANGTLEMTAVTENGD